MAAVTYPVLTVVDDAGAVVSGATVTITSVKTRDGTDIASPGATVYQSGANVSVEYDAESKGEAWVVLAVSKVGSTFTGLNAAPAFYLARDSSRVLTALTAGGAVVLPANPPANFLNAAAIAADAITAAKIAADAGTEIAAAVWLATTRTLTSAGSGGATAQEVWEYASRTLTGGVGGLDAAGLRAILGLSQANLTALLTVQEVS